jgi:hypothetical protein
LKPVARSSACADCSMISYDARNDLN